MSVYMNKCLSKPVYTSAAYLPLLLLKSMMHLINLVASLYSYSLKSVVAIMPFTAGKRRHAAWLASQEAGCLVTCPVMFRMRHFVG